VTSLNPRQEEILEQARRQGFVGIDALATHFSVTQQTVRSDINQLCDQGLLRRYHGGAGLPSSAENVSYRSRQIMSLEEKQRIAKEVSSRIPDHASLFINIGTTTEEVAKALLNHHNLRIITNNLNVAQIVSANPDFEVIIAGGAVRNRDGGIIGEATVDFINQFKVDFGIIGISGIDTDGTLLDFDYREVRVAQAIIANARNVLLVADHTKFGRSAMVRLGPISQIDVLITDQAPPEPIAEILAAADIDIIVAAPNG
jgi:DeoR family glycerol-3-phosphate regulon repressor